MVTPLLAEGHLLGFMVVVRYPVDAFSSVEREFLRALTDHISLAIYHAQLYSDLQVAYDELRQTQRAVMQQEQLRAFGQMASGIAHDIKMLLRRLSSTPTCWRSTLAWTGHSREQVETIRLACDDISRTVDRLHEVPPATRGAGSRNAGRSQSGRGSGS